MNGTKCLVEAFDGFSIGIQKPLFTKDSKLLLLCCGEKVKVYSTVTGKLVRLLSAQSKSHVTCITFNPLNLTQVISLTEDGKMRFWDCTDGSLLNFIDFNQPLYYLCTRPIRTKGQMDLALLRKCQRTKPNKERDDSWEVACLSLKDVLRKHRGEESAGILATAPILLKRLSSHSTIVFTHKGDHLVGYSKRKILVYSFLLDTVISHSQDHHVTCLAAHPNRDSLATGNSIGEILIWYNFGNPLEAPVKSKLHWHAHQVNDLHFTSSGANLFSVGIEGVVVSWHVESRKKHFIPRLGGSIQRVTTNPLDDLIVITLNSNIIKFLSVRNNKVERILGGLYRAYLEHIGKNGVLTGLVRSPMNECIALNSSLGHIQFYHPAKQELMMENKGLYLVRALDEDARVFSFSFSSSPLGHVNATNLNYVSQADNKPLVPTVISFVTFSSDGQWMATVESRDDEVTTPELRMKVWQFKAEIQTYELNSLMDPPHYSPITSLSSRPGGGSYLFVSTASDGHFKLWTTETAKDNRQRWYCQAESYYLKEVAIGSAFSQDGSLLAVVYNSHLTLWKVSTCELKKVVAPITQSEMFKHVCFSCCGSDHFLVVTSSNHLTVWNLLTDAVCWSVRAVIDHIILSPCSGYLAAVVRAEESLKMCVFTPKQCAPLDIYECGDSTAILGAVFMKNLDTAASIASNEDCWSKELTLYFLNQDQVMYRIGLPIKKHTTETLPPKEATQTSFEQIFGKHPGGKPVVKEGEDAPHSVFSTQDLLKVLSGPPHTLPPMSVLCKAFFKSVDKTMPESENFESEMDHDGVNTDDSDSEGESGTTVRKSAVKSELKETAAVLHTKVEALHQTDSISTSRGDFDWLAKVFKTFK